MNGYSYYYSKNIEPTRKLSHIEQNRLVLDWSKIKSTATFEQFEEWKKQNADKLAVLDGMSFSTIMKSLNASFNPSFFYQTRTKNALYA